jgi:hypothetical protein
VPLRLVQVNFKARDEVALGRFWAEALGWEQSSEAPGVANLEPFDIPLPDPRAIGIDVVAVPDPESVKYRVHLELATSSPAHHTELVARLAALGATSAGGSDLADPEGNFFRVLTPSALYEGTGPLAVVVVECAEPRVLSQFWGQATDWTVLETSDRLARLRSAQGVGPFLEFRAAASSRPSRVHLDVRPYPGDDQAVEVARLAALGAREADIGQGDVPWTVMADPEGNEFCVLTPG